MLTLDSVWSWLFDFWFQFKCNGDFAWDSNTGIVEFLLQGPGGVEFLQGLLRALPLLVLLFLDADWSTYRLVYKSGHFLCFLFGIMNGKQTSLMSKNECYLNKLVVNLVFLCIYWAFDNYCNRVCAYNKITLNCICIVNYSKFQKTHTWDSVMLQRNEKILVSTLSLLGLVSPPVDWRHFDICGGLWKELSLLHPSDTLNLTDAYFYLSVCQNPEIDIVYFC